MTTLQILKEARLLISDPERWTKGTFARNSENDPVLPDDKQAVCWCAVGSVGKVCETDSEGFGKVTNELSLIVAPDFIGDFNDTHSHPEVLAMFDKAITKLEEVK